MKQTLVDTGFVGRALAAAAPFDARYTDENIGDSFGGDNGLVVHSGVPHGALAPGQPPEAGLALAREMFDGIARMQPEKLVLVSSAEVYPRPAGVYEDSPVPGGGTAMGGACLALEGLAREAFPNALIVRLPALFGEGVFDNFIYDMLAAASGRGQDALGRTDSRALLQFYDLENLWADIGRCLKQRLALVNFATAPVEAGMLYHSLFGEAFENRLDGPLARHDVRTRYGREFGGHDDYLADRTEVVAGIARFVSRRLQQGEDDETG